MIICIKKNNLKSNVNLFYLSIALSRLIYFTGKKTLIKIYLLNFLKFYFYYFKFT